MLSFIIVLDCSNRFMYTDGVILTKDNALHLLYAAQKYMLPALEKKCTVYLENSISEHTVCTILSHCIRFSHPGLSKRWDITLNMGVLVGLENDVQLITE